MTKAIDAAIKDGTIEDKIVKLEAHKKAIEEKIAECKEALERSKKPKLAIPFMPKAGEKYWLYINGRYCSTINEKTQGDIERIKEGNSFRTEDEAKLAYEKRCAETELLMMCDFFELSNKQYYTPFFGNKDKIWNAESSFNCTMSPYRFASEELCQAAIDKLGDRKLRLIFNIQLKD